MPNVTSGWTPVTIGELTRIMDGAPFFWCLAGGHAIERMVGHPYRAHDDLDIVVLRSQQTAVQEWFRDWMLAAADPPKACRTAAATSPGRHDLGCTPARNTSCSARCRANSGSLTRR